MKLNERERCIIKFAAGCIARFETATRDDELIGLIEKKGVFPPDPRDARIAELEGLLREAVVEINRHKGIVCDNWGRGQFMDITDEVMARIDALLHEPNGCEVLKEYDGVHFQDMDGGLWVENPVEITTRAIATHTTITRRARHTQEGENDVGTGR